MDVFLGGEFYVFRKASLDQLQAGATGFQKTGEVSSGAFVRSHGKLGIGGARAGKLRENRARTDEVFESGAQAAVGFPALSGGDHTDSGAEATSKFRDGASVSEAPGKRRNLARQQAERRAVR